jgi:transposase InsO family protein
VLPESLQWQGEEAMKKSKFTEEQILFVLKQGDAGQPIADVCRQMGISEATYYVWKKRYEEARAVLRSWRHDYNHHRPHGSLGHLTPSEFALKGQKMDAEAPKL